MEKSKLIGPEQREQFKKYPLYSQDGKKGEAIALFRLFITGTRATFYILEGAPNGEYDGIENFQMFGVSNMEQEGWRYSYFSSAELESLILKEGLIHTERDLNFTPRKLSEIPEVLGDLDELWQWRPDEDEE